MNQVLSNTFKTFISLVILMIKEIVYLTTTKVGEFNLLAINIIKAKKADRFAILNKAKLIGIINDCEELEGDVYDKAVCLLKGIIQKHPFASGNRRTAFIACKDFLELNGAEIKISDEPSQAKTMQGIRENFYDDEDGIKMRLKR